MNSLQNNIQALEQQFSELLLMINYHRSRASQAVNEQQLLTAWNVGAYVYHKLKTEQWGSQKGFSRRSIYDIVIFYEACSNPSFLATVPTHLPNLIVQLLTAQLNKTDKTIKSEALEIVQTRSAQLIQSKIGQMLVNI